MNEQSIETEQSTEAEQSIEKELGISREGIKKGSRIVPLIFLVAVVLVFVANVLDSYAPPLVLEHVSDVNQGPTFKKNAWVIWRVKPDDKANFENQGKLHFSVFEDSRKPIITTDEDKIIKLATDDKAKTEVKKQLTELNKALDKHWEGDEIPEDEKLDILVQVAKLTGHRPSVAYFAAIGASWLAAVIVHDFPLLFLAQLKTVWILLVYSLIPGILGLIYRRNFWAWFLASAGILFAINWGYGASSASSISAELKNKLEIGWTEDLFLFTEVLLILLLAFFRFRRHAVAAIDAETKRSKISLALLFIAVALAWFIWIVTSKPVQFSLLPIVSIPILLLTAYSVLRQTLRSEPEGARSKNIVVCLDGTWNEPGQTDFGFLAWTNVFKIFRMLKGDRSRKHYNASRTKEYRDEKDPRLLKQIGFYYHGVGNKVENSELGQLFGGVFGMGATAIVERAYLDVVRVYRPGDRIFIFGFSRGAAIARLVAGVIGIRGVPVSLWTLRLFGQHRTVWKSSKRIESVPVEVLGCWDTVGSFGLSKNILGIPFQKINLLKDLAVSLCVKRAFHMVALDEMRDSFEPTLMHPDPTAPDRIVEVWFSGNHANVGGGYATDKLSNVTLDFLLSYISSGYAYENGMTPGDESWGMYLSAVKKGVDCDTEDIIVIEPDPKGRLRQSSGGPYDYAPRQLPIHAVIYDTVFERMKDSIPVYAPQSLFNLNEELVQKRAAIETEVKRLAETHTIDEEESTRIREWSDKKLGLTKWSKYLATELDDQSVLEEKLKLTERLSNATF